MAPVTVDLIKIGKAAEKIAPIRTAMHRVEDAQRGVNVVRILIKARAQSARVELFRDAARLLGVHACHSTCNELLEEREHCRRIFDVSIVTGAGNVVGLRGVHP